ncbi:hypothetical protein ACU8KH_02103 [Lachancea thermotolerans]
MCNKSVHGFRVLQPRRAQTAIRVFFFAGATLVPPILPYVLSL